MSPMPWEAPLCLSPSRQAAWGPGLRIASVYKRKKIACKEGERVLHMCLPIESPWWCGVGWFFFLSEFYGQENGWSGKLHGELKVIWLPGNKTESMFSHHDVMLQEFWVGGGGQLQHHSSLRSPSTRTQILNTSLTDGPGMHSYANAFLTSSRL